MRDAVGAIAFAVVLALAGAVQAGQPVVINEDIDFSFTSGFWTGTCGLPVVQRVQGKSQVRLFTAADGTLHELDTLPSLKIELSAPSTGGSFSYPLGPAVFDYPAGVYVGAPSIVTTYGVQRRAPGLPAEAGLTVFEGVVIFIIDGILPVVDFGPPAVDEHGNVNDLSDMIDAACTALRG